MEDIPFRRKFYCKDRINDVMAGKGEYLLKEGDRLFIAQNKKYRESVLIVLSYKDLINGWEPIGYDENKIWILSFSLRREQLSSSLGKRVEYLMNRLTEKAIQFRISKPLPSCIFKDGKASIRKYKIPLSCKDCLQFFILDKEGKDNLYCFLKHDHFIFFQGGRHQCVELFRSMVGTGRLNRCKTCAGNGACGFWFWKRSCYNYPKMPYIIKKAKTINAWKQKNSQVILTPWWFLMHKWQTNFDIDILRGLFKNRLKNKYIIDMGGGHGRNTFGLRRISKKVVLVDIVREFFKYTKIRQQELNDFFPIVDANIEELPFKDNCCSLIYSGGVLHAMDRNSQERHLRQCHRVLKAEGLLFGPVIAEWEVGQPAGLWPIHYKTKLILMLKRAGFDKVWIYGKFRDTASPLQFWLFGALKSPARAGPARFDRKILWNHDYSLFPHYWVSPRFRSGKVFALYHCRRKEYHIMGSSFIKVWDLIASVGINSLRIYLERISAKEREEIEDELNLLIKGGYMGLYQKKGEKCTREIM